MRSQLLQQSATLPGAGGHDLAQVFAEVRRRPAERFLDAPGRVRITTIEYDGEELAHQPQRFFRQTLVAHRLDEFVDGDWDELDGITHRFGNFRCTLREGQSARTADFEQPVAKLG